MAEKLADDVAILSLGETVLNGNGNRRKEANEILKLTHP
jgi:hypothetical protein